VRCGTGAADVGPARARHQAPLNRVTEAELARSAGGGRGGGRALVQARPFHSWDEVDAVRGVGPTRLRLLQQALNSIPETFPANASPRPSCRSPVPTATRATRWMTAWSPPGEHRCSAPAAGWCSPPSAATAARGGAAAALGTLPFGSAARTAGPIRTEAYGQSPPPSGSTQVFGNRPAGASPPPGANRTQVFGSGTSEPARTQVFGRRRCPGLRHRRARRTGPRSSGEPRGEPAARAASRGAHPGLRRSAGGPVRASASARTQVFGGGAGRVLLPLHRPSRCGRRCSGRGSPVAGAPPLRPAMRTAVFGGAAAQSPDGLDLPPMSGDGSFAGGVPSLELPGADRSPCRCRAPSPRGCSDRIPRSVRSPGAAAPADPRGVDAGRAGAAGGGRLGRLGAVDGRSAVPASVRAERDEAFTRLRRDDSQSRAAAMKVLDTLAERYPQWVGVRATQALAQTLELDDQRPCFAAASRCRGAEDDPCAARGRAHAHGLEGPVRRGPGAARAAAQANRSDGGRGERARVEAQRHPRRSQPVAPGERGRRAGAPPGGRGVRRGRGPGRARHLRCRALQAARRQGRLGGGCLRRVRAQRQERPSGQRGAGR
jgi:hypothetical protein